MIRKLDIKDKDIYIEMTKAFYSTDAVSNNISEKHFHTTFNELIQSDRYANCYIIEYNEDIAGYMLLAKTFSQEAGGIVIWIEELYIKPKYRSKGIGHKVFKFIKENISPKVKRIRLEVEQTNKRAISLYQKLGFTKLNYMQMIKEL